MIKEINDFINNYQIKYDYYRINIYPNYKNKKNYFEIMNHNQINENFIKKEYHECIFRDTRIREYNRNEIEVDRIRNFAFEYNNKLIIVQFINRLKKNDIPFLNKYHNEKHIIEYCFDKGDYEIVNIIENNINYLETSEYSYLRFKENTKFMDL